VSAQIQYTKKITPKSVSIAYRLQNVKKEKPDVTSSAETKKSRQAADLELIVVAVLANLAVWKNPGRHDCEKKECDHNKKWPPFHN
jgi:hypothetical protein